MCSPFGLGLLRCQGVPDVDQDREYTAQRPGEQQSGYPACDEASQETHDREPSEPGVAGDAASGEGRGYWDSHCHKCVDGTYPLCQESVDLLWKLIPSPSLGLFVPR